MIVDSFGDHASCSILEGYHHLGILLNQIFRKLMTGRAGFEHFFCSDFVSEGDPPKQTFWYLVYLIIHIYIYIYRYPTTDSTQELFGSIRMQIIVLLREDDTDNRAGILPPIEKLAKNRLL